MKYAQILIFRDFENIIHVKNSQRIQDIKEAFKKGKIMF